MPFRGHHRFSDDVRQISADCKIPIQAGEAEGGARDEAPAYVDRRLTTLKAWRDIHHYNSDGNPTGWTRHMNGRTFEFDPEGRLLTQVPGGPATPVHYVNDEKSGRLLFVPK